MDQESFKALVNKGIKAIPEKFLKKLDNVAIVIEDEPNPHQLNKLKNKNLIPFEIGKNLDSFGIRKGSLILGLYEGVPQTDRGNYGQVLPDKITIFKKSIERIAQSEEEIQKIVKDTIWHEIAHHFGMSEKEIRKKENSKGKSQINNKININ